MSLVVESLPWVALPQGAPIADRYQDGLRLVIDGGAQFPQAQALTQIDADGFRIVGTQRVSGSGIGWSGAASTFVSARTTAANPAPLLEIPANSSWTAQFVIDGISGISGTNFGFFRSGITYAGPTFIVQDGSSRRPWVRVNATDVLRPGSGAQWTTGQRINLIVRFRNASRADAWWDGRLQHSASHSASQDALLSTSGVHALMMQNTNEITGGNLTAFRFWTRYLDDGQTEALANNEHALYEPLRIWVPVTAPSGGGDVSVSLSGASVTASAGTTSPANALPLSGQSVATTAGTIAPARTVAISGQSATVSQGAVTAVAAGGATLTGQSVSASAGTVAPSRTVALSGQAATVAVGTTAPQVSKALTGQAATSAAGTSVPATSKALTGQAATVSAGTVSAAAAGSVSLSGQQATVSAGTVAPARTVALSGQSATVSTGTVTAETGTSVTVALNGASVSTAAGSVGMDRIVSLSGVSALIRAGQIVIPGADTEVAYPLMGQRQSFVLAGRNQASVLTDPQPYPLAGRTQP
jgi:hypothetical protein